MGGISSTPVLLKDASKSERRYKWRKENTMRVSQDREVSIAVGVVRDLEALLRKASRKPRLSARQRVRLRQYADLLKERRRVSGGEVQLSRKCWLLMLRALSWVMRHRSLKELVEHVMGSMK